LIRTFDPRGTFLFGSGFWAVTVPFGWVPGTRNSTGTSPAVRNAPLASAASWPRTSGTVAGPFEAFSETVELLATFAPAAGLWATTTPAAACAETVVTCPVSPAARRRARAAEVFDPTTSGT
jgi:hypothetical protein